MKKTILNQIHREQGGKMIEFAGYDMPIQYSLGMLKEHEWVRAGNVGIFDVSHMGQFIMEGDGADKILSRLTPTDFSNIEIGLAKYTVLMNPEGGIIDDLIITKMAEDKFFVVLNAACKEKDSGWILANLSELPNLKFSELANRALIAVQGVKAEEVLSKIFVQDADLANLAYMHLKQTKLKTGEEVFISRTGYTGEDGFEISIKNDAAVDLWKELSSATEVKQIGLGARDSLRLEAGYPLYGNDLDDSTSPIEATIGWVVSRTNQNFIGSERVLQEKADGVKRKRMGVKLLDRGVIREGCEIKKDGKKIGVLTSGGFSPTLKCAIGQGYFDPQNVKAGDEVVAIVRGNEIKAAIHPLTFVAARTKSFKKV